MVEMMTQNNEQGAVEKKKKYATLKELAEYLDIHYYTARAMVVTEKKIPYMRSGQGKLGNIRIEWANIYKYEQECTKRTMGNGE